MESLFTTTIDFLNIDIEGLDFEALQGLNFEKYDPKLICIEVHDFKVEDSKVYEFLKKKNYKLVWSGIFSHLFKKYSKETLCLKFLVLNSFVSLSFFKEPSSFKSIERF